MERPSSAKPTSQFVGFQETSAAWVPRYSDLEVVTAETAPSGRPVQISGSRGPYRVRRVLGEWQAPGEARLYRLQVSTPDGPAVAEVVSPTAGGGELGGWRLRQIWRPYGHDLGPGRLLVGWAPGICAEALGHHRGHRTHQCLACLQWRITSVHYAPPHLGGGHPQGQPGWPG
jgi:hypothetical protein